MICEPCTAPGAEPGPDRKPAPERNVKPELYVDRRVGQSQEPPQRYCGEVPKQPETPTPPTQKPQDPKQVLGDLPRKGEIRQTIKPPDASPNPVPEPTPPDDGVWRSGPIALEIIVPPTVPGAPELPPDSPAFWPHLQDAGLPRNPASWYLRLRDSLGNNLLMVASRAGQPDIVAFLLETCPLSYAQALNMMGQNAAMIARDCGHTDVLLLLMQAGVALQPANPALQWYLQNRGDLADAARIQDWQPLAILLGQDHYMNLRDANGRTLLFHAVMNADLEAIRFLCGRLHAPYLGWKDVAGYSVFRYATQIPNVQTGAAICRELRTYRRRMRWQHHSMRTEHRVMAALEFSESVVNSVNT